MVKVLSHESLSLVFPYATTKTLPAWVFALLWVPAFSDQQLCQCVQMSAGIECLVGLSLKNENQFLNLKFDVTGWIWVLRSVKAMVQSLEDKTKRNIEIFYFLFSDEEVMRCWEFVCVRQLRVCDVVLSTGHSCRRCRCCWPSGTTAVTTPLTSSSEKSSWTWRPPTSVVTWSGSTCRNTTSTAAALRRRRPSLVVVRKAAPPFCVAGASHARVPEIRRAETSTPRTLPVCTAP